MTVVAVGLEIFLLITFPELCDRLFFLTSGTFFREKNRQANWLHFDNRGVSPLHTRRDTKNLGFIGYVIPTQTHLETLFLSID